MRIPFNSALITGSSRGMGRQIAVKLATEGVKKIAVHYRPGKEDAQVTVSKLTRAVMRAIAPTFRTPIERNCCADFSLSS